MRVPEFKRLVVYVRMWTFGREERSSGPVWFRGVALREALLREVGVGAQDTDMTCSRPVRHIESIISPLKKDRSIDLS